VHKAFGGSKIAAGDVDGDVQILECLRVRTPRTAPEILDDQHVSRGMPRTKGTGGCLAPDEPRADHSDTHAGNQLSP
jgi:hypothetical protein